MKLHRNLTAKSAAKPAGQRKRDLSPEEWATLAADMQTTLAKLRAIHSRFAETTRKTDVELVRRAIKHAQVVWSRAEDLAGDQCGDAFAMKHFHGGDWVFFA